MRWILSRSTSSWIFVRVWAGTPPPSALKSSTLRSASMLLRSFRYCTSARSMSMPPEASGPVFTVTKPRRIGPAWARAGTAAAAAALPAAWMKRLRVNDITGLLEFFEELLVGYDPTQAARHVLQAEHMEIFPVHARHAVREHDDAIVEVEGGERRVQHAGVRVDAHQHHVLHLQRLQELPQVGAIEAIQPLLVVDDVVPVLVQLRNDLRARRALDVVLAHRALAARRQAVGLALRRVHRLPEGRGHAFAADARDAAIHQHDVDDGHLQPPRMVQRGASVLDDSRGVLRLRRHRGHVHIQVAAMHVDGDHRRFGGLELELAVQTGDQAGTVYDLDWAHGVSLSGKMGSVPVFRFSFSEVQRPAASKDARG